MKDFRLPHGGYFICQFFFIFSIKKGLLFLQNRSNVIVTVPVLHPVRSAHGSFFYTKLSTYLNFITRVNRE